VTHARKVGLKTHPVVSALGQWSVNRTVPAMVAYAIMLLLEVSSSNIVGSMLAHSERTQ
jgi:hypothetical protein